MFGNYFTRFTHNHIKRLLAATELTLTLTAH